MYYIFVALLPMPFPGGSYSEGKYILNLIWDKEHLWERTNRVQWYGEYWQRCLLDHKGELVRASEDIGQILAKAHEVAQINRPIQLVKIDCGKEVEVYICSSFATIWY